MATERGSVGRVLDPTVRTLIKQLQDQVAALQAQVQVLQQVNRFDAQGRRLQNVADPAAASDAATRGYVDRSSGQNQVLVTRVGVLVAGEIPAELIVPGTFGSARKAGTSSKYFFPSALDVGGYLRITDLLEVPTTGEGVEIFYNPAIPRGQIEVYDRDASAYRALRIHTSTLAINDVAGTGNVGINVTAPASTLDVGGTVHATGNVDFDGNLNVDGTGNIEGQLTVDDILVVTGNASFLADATTSGEHSIGTLKTGTVSPITTEAVTDFLTILDSAGNPVKLAVVT